MPLYLFTRYGHGNEPGSELLTDPPHEILGLPEHFEEAFAYDDNRRHLKPAETVGYGILDHPEIGVFSLEEITLSHPAMLEWLSSLPPSERYPKDQ